MCHDPPLWETLFWVMLVSYLKQIIEQLPGCSAESVLQYLLAGEDEPQVANFLKLSAQQHNPMHILQGVSPIEHNGTYFGVDLLLARVLRLHLFWEESCHFSHRLGGFLGVLQLDGRQKFKR